MKKILCVCYGNTCRSPMLQALLSRELKSRGIEAEVESAGVFDEAGALANEKAVICMQERGLDITSHRSRRISDVDLKTYDHIYCVEKKGITRLVDLGVPTERVELIEGVINPYKRDIEVYRACADELMLIATKLAVKLAHNQ